MDDSKKCSKCKQNPCDYICSEQQFPKPEPKPEPMCGYCRHYNAEPYKGKCPQCAADPVAAMVDAWKVIEVYIKSRDLDLWEFNRALLEAVTEIDSLQNKYKQLQRYVKDQRQRMAVMSSTIDHLEKMNWPADQPYRKDKPADEINLGPRLCDVCGARATMTVRDYMEISTSESVDAVLSPDLRHGCDDHPVNSRNLST